MRHCWKRLCDERGYVTIDNHVRLTHKGRYRAARAAKKGKSSEFNQKNNEQAKFSPSLKVWSHEGVKVAVKFEKRVKFRVP